MNHFLMLYEESKHKTIACRGSDAKKRHVVVMVITQELGIGKELQGCNLSRLPTAHCTWEITFVLLYMHLNIIGDNNFYVNNANPVRMKIQSTKQEIYFTLQL